MIGSYVRYLRRQRGWTQEDLADRADLGQNHVSAIERGQRENMTYKTIAKLAGAFGVTVEQLNEGALSMMPAGTYNDMASGEGEEGDLPAAEIAEALAQLRRKDPTLARVMESILSLPPEWRDQAVAQLQAQLDLLQAIGG